MARAILLVREKKIYENGDILEAVVWRVPAAPGSLSGVRYRLVFVRHGQRVPYRFVDVERLLEDFIADVRRVSGDDEWPRR